MIKIGRNYICDRCGKEVFVGSSESKSGTYVPRNGYEDMGGADERVSTYPVMWKQAYGMDLCKDCAKDFEKWMRYRGNAEEC